MEDIIKLPFQFNSAKLQEDYKKLSNSEWTPHFNSRDYEGEWNGFALRGASEAIHPILRLAPHPGIESYSDYEALDYCLYIKEVIDSFKCKKNSVRLLNLKAGAVIKEHTDHDLDFTAGEARIHVPILTNPGVIFILNGSRVVMNEGEAWYLNFSLPHSIKNNGQTDRVHLVIDCKVNDWMNEILTGS